MKARALIECTIDTASPVSELAAAISIVLAALPDEATRLATLEALGDEIDRTLAAQSTEAD
ncbi:hypothetical protein [Gorillibacterium sp. sgz500922]|uniref:hypothetical protein n=1 Tax=Gorillibacterium sp. sgz500922 TaxID=3446694 RepID=UPI003F6673F5